MSTNQKKEQRQDSILLVGLIHSLLLIAIIAIDFFALTNTSSTSTYSFSVIPLIILVVSLSWIKRNKYQNNDKLSLAIQIFIWIVIMMFYWWLIQQTTGGLPLLIARFCLGLQLIYSLDFNLGASIVNSLMLMGVTASLSSDNSIIFACWLVVYSIVAIPTLILYHRFKIGLSNWENRWRKKPKTSQSQSSFFTLKKIFYYVLIVIFVGLLTSFILPRYSFEPPNFSKMSSLRYDIQNKINLDSNQSTLSENLDNWDSSKNENNLDSSQNSLSENQNNLQNDRNNSKNKNNFNKLNRDSLSENQNNLQDDRNNLKNENNFKSNRDSLQQNHNNLKEGNRTNQNSKNGEKNTNNNKNNNRNYDNDNQEKSDRNTGLNQLRKFILNNFILVVLLAVIGFIFWWIIEYTQKEVTFIPSSYKQRHPVTKLYREMLDLLRQKGHPKKLAQTPYEYTYSLKNIFLSEQWEIINVITNSYVKWFYGNVTPNIGYLRSQFQLLEKSFEQSKRNNSKQ